MKKIKSVLLTTLCMLTVGAFSVGSLAACDNTNETLIPQNNVSMDNDATLVQQLVYSANTDNIYLSAMMAAQDLSWSDSVVQAEYDYNSQFTLPTKTVNIDGVDIPCETYLIYPNGKGTKKTSVVLDQAGKYELRYVLVREGKPYLSIDTFKVSQQTVYVETNDSIVSYGKNAYSDNEGLNVCLSNNDVLTFGEPIDLSNYTKDVPLIELYATSSLIGEWDFSKLFITFTDVSDPNVYLTIKVQRSKINPYYHRTYIQAGGNGQELTGWLKTATVDRVCVEDDQGTLTSHSFIGESTIADWSVDKYPVRIFFDPTTLELYNDDTLIVDLDAEKHFANLWNGFKSDQVFLSITADEYTGQNTANFCVKDVYGLDLSQKTFEDKDAPVITVEDEETYCAKVGGVYPVGKAIALDAVDGYRDVSVSAWYDYSSNNPIKLNIKDGQFETKYSGMYAIVYESVDKTGNLARYVKNVSTGSVEPLSVSVQAETQSVSLGEWIKIPEYSTSGGNGAVKVDIYADLNGQRSLIANDGFRPEKEGAWKFVYVARDAVGQISTATYEFEAQKGDKPVFVEEPTLPPVFISGSSYTVPEVYAKDYSTGNAVEKLATLKVEDANGVKTYSAGDIFIPTVNENGDNMTLTFECGGSSYIKEVPAVIVWVNDGRPRLYMERYLYGDDFTVEKNKADITVVAQGEDASWVFANALIAEGFTTQIDADPDFAQYDGIKIKLWDSLDSSSALEFSIIKYGSKSKLKINDTEIVMPIGFINESYSKAFPIEYKNGELSVGATTLPVDTRFNSGKLYFQVSFIGAEEGAKYKILKINDTVMCDLLADRSGPKIAVYGELGGCFQLNETFVIPSAIAGDVFDPNVTVTVSVLDVNGNYMKDINGLELKNVAPNREYTITMKEYGDYTVVYTANDTFNKTPNPTGLSFSLHVEDNEAPIVKLNGELPASANIGDTIKIVDVSATDNCTETSALIITKCIVLPSGRMIVVSGEENAFKCEQAGIYEVRIYVTDEAGNGTLIRKYIEVK